MSADHSPYQGPSAGSSGQPGRATPYRMLVTTALPPEDAVSLADQLLAAWLKEEGHLEPPPAVPGRSPERLRLGERVLLDRDCGPLPEHAGSFTRRRLRRPVPYGTEQLTFVVAAGLPGEPAWVRLEAEYLPGAAGVRPPSRVPVPAVARSLLPLLDAADGPANVEALPRLVGAAGVDALIDELCDPERRLPTVVLSVPCAQPVSAWLAEVGHPLLQQLPGLAVGYVLDHAALPVFNLKLEYHKVYGGAVRTYLPEVDPASRADSLRHPVLPRHRIEEDVRRAAGLLAREPRQHSVGRALPGLLDATPPFQPPPEATLPPQPKAPVGELIAHQPSRPALRQVGGQLRVAARRLCTVAAPAPAPLLLPGPAGYPGSFGELVSRFPEFSLLEFTGDEKEALALDGQSDGIGWARLTWEGLIALQEYAEVAVRGEAHGDFKLWCEHTPPGCHRFPPRKAVRGESRTVESHTKWKRERMLPVPECVDASRRAFMGAHLRIGGGRTAPRLHYLDDCSGSGRIYVGYIGLHLTNTLTN